MKTKPYPQPTADAIAAEADRLRPQYEAFMKANGETPDPDQLRDWAAENLRERIILETDAKAAGLTVDALMRQIADAAPKPTLDDARAAFKAHPERFVAPERVHAQHIVIHRDQAEGPAQATLTLQNLRADILAGRTTWEEAAAAHSSCPGNDDLGFFPRGAMVQPFEDAAFATPEDTITDVVETPFGWHLIRVLAHLPEEPMLFEEAKDALLAELREARERAALEAYVDARKAHFAP